MLYDYRLVHAGSPNEGPVAESDEEGGAEGGPEGGAEGGVEWGERPILQLTYSRRGYRDRFRNYGFEQLFCD